jgi:hypothetical protein
MINRRDFSVAMLAGNLARLGTRTANLTPHFS